MPSDAQQGEIQFSPLFLSKACEQFFLARKGNAW
jgi:hypothetical protein